MDYRKIDISQAAMYNIDEETAKEFIDHRINIKKPLTQGAFNRALKAAAKCEAQGIPAQEAMEITIDKAWQGVVPEYIIKEVENRKNAMAEVAYGQCKQLSSQGWQRGSGAVERGEAAIDEAFGRNGPVHRGNAERVDQDEAAWPTHSGDGSVLDSGPH